MISNPAEFSTITIIGSGPAGAVASMFLSRQNIYHTILDKASFPRDKVCGDGLSGKAVSVIKKLDPQILEEMKAAEDTCLGSWGVVFAAPNGKKLEIPFKKDMSSEPHPPGFVARRIDFDHFLMKKSVSPYAHRIDSAEVLQLSKKTDGIELIYRYQERKVTANTKLIIAADGERSITSRTFFNEPMRPSHFYAGIRGYYHNVSGCHPQNFIELHFLPDLLPGYFWIFPLPGGKANVGVCVLSSKAGKDKMNLREKMLDIIANRTGISERFREAVPEGKIAGWGLPLGSYKRKLSTDHVMLTGDAASLIDPFTGEGIGNAMMSGMIAARAAEKAVEQNDFTGLFLSEIYDKEIEKSLRDELKLSYTMQRLCKKPWLFNFVASRSEKNATLRETISCMFEDLDMRTRLRDPKYYLKLLFNT